MAASITEPHAIAVALEPTLDLVIWWLYFRFDIFENHLFVEYTHIHSIEAAIEHWPCDAYGRWWSD